MLLAMLCGEIVKCCMGVVLGICILVPSLDLLPFGCQVQMVLANMLTVI